MNIIKTALASAAVVCGLATSAFAADLTLKLGHIAEAEHPYAQGADYFAKRVGELSDGAIEVKVFPSSQLGDQKSLIEGLVYGTVDMALTGTAVLGQFLPEISIFDLPFLFKDREHAYASLDTVGMDMGADLENRGIKLLGFMENGIRHMTNSKHPITTPADMDGLKIRVMSNKIYVETMNTLGASATPMAFDELYTALQQHTVDGQENPSAHIFTKRFFEVQPYASLTAHAYSPEPVLISMATWSRMTPEQQEIVQQAAKDAVDWQRDLSTKKDQEYWDEIKATGKMEVIEVDRDAFAEAVKPVYEEFSKMVGQENLDRIAELGKDK
ncbi:DctP family TRAP transporter solute-binding subunit [Tropicimonas isoalkanivorans]|uniref:Tripartite ATP-independent transporter solute receptor, DctP family n=1 Tax=Tropicimonas isoalkanivorans TaxID=441112 RepID=A0A1I1Q6T8_9RHOB|nr:DctP family TRAP transporter solute-binding subunit [Tropicimonas isoalkanivorans]SFD17765.1 tripartite ATP-independent transporter solute receptor, DctP family [Tropicimonas isoalkanivorans]